MEIAEEFKRINGEFPPNIWDIVEYGKDSYEIRYSKFLRWLLDPKENHKAGPVLAEELWQIFKGEKVVFSMNSETTAEEENIDVLLVDEENEKYIAIELKVWTDAHNEQLKNYGDYLEETYPDYSGLKIFLTPFGRKPADEAQWDDRWVCMDYSTLDNPFKKIIAKVCQERVSYRFHILKLIDDFWYDLMRQVEGESFKQLVLESLESDELYTKEKYDVIKIEEAVNALDFDEIFKAKFIEEIKKIIPVQDKTPYPKGQLLIRKIFNEIALEKLSLESEENFGRETKEQRFSEANEAYKELGIQNINVTQRKGQGLNLRLTDQEFPFIYMSVCSKGIFPNDGFILVYEDREDNERYWPSFRKLKVSDCLDENDNFKPGIMEKIKDTIKEGVELHYSNEV